VKKEGKMDAQELVKRYQAGERKFTVVDLHRAVLKGFQLKEADFSFSNMIGVDLSGANLQKTKFMGAILYNANLSYANLDHANLSEAKLDGADLTGAILTWASFYKSSLNKAKMGYTEMTSASLIQADLTDANLEKADLRGAHLEKTDLTNANLSFAVVDNKTTFVLSNLTGAVLEGVNLLHLPKSVILPDGKQLTKKTDPNAYITMPPIPEGETHPLLTKNESNQIRYRVSFPTSDIQQALGLLMEGFRWPERCPCCGGVHDRYVSVQGGAEIVTGRFGIGTGYIGMHQRIPYCTDCLQHQAFADSPKIPGLGILWIFELAVLMFFATLFLYFNLTQWFEIFQYLVPIFMTCLFIFLSFLILRHNIRKRRKALAERETYITSWLKPTCTSIKGLAAGFYADKHGAHAYFANEGYAADFAKLNGGTIEEYRI
jgi:hypothetical protein